MEEQGLRAWRIAYDEQILSGSDQLTALRNALRSCAQNLQRENPQAFFTVRQIARAFSVSFSTVSKAVNQLKREGLFDIVRSHKIMVRGSAETRDFLGKSVVGLIISKNLFLHLPHYREFYLELRNELRLHGFARDILSAEDEEVAARDSKERLAGWYAGIVMASDRLALDTGMTISDRGAPIVLLGEKHAASGEFNYRIDHLSTLSASLAQWQREGTQVAVPTWSHIPDEVLYDRTLRGVSLNIGRELPFHGQCADGTIRYLTDLLSLQRQGVVFTDPVFPQFLLMRAPELMFEIMSKHHVLYAAGTVTGSYGPTSEAHADFILCDWTTVIRKVIRDLSTRQIPEPDHPYEFSTECRRQPVSASGIWPI